MNSPLKYPVSYTELTPEEKLFLSSAAQTTQAAFLRF